MLNEYYQDSGLRISNGDRIILDGRIGTIEEVCLPQSPSSLDYNCHTSGGLLILFDDAVLELIPFGFDRKIEKWSS
jgi:hypothetical protein